MKNKKEVISFISFGLLCDKLAMYKPEIVMKVDDMLLKSSNSDRGEFARIMNDLIKYVSHDSINELREENKRLKEMLTDNLFD